jgi:hypothetical protein
MRPEAGTEDQQIDGILMAFQQVSRAPEDRLRKNHKKQSNLT